MTRTAPATGHPLANGVCAGRADSTGVELDGGRIDALVAAAGQVLRTSAPEQTTFGVAQVRRMMTSPVLDLLHVVFAPRAERPLLLGLARLRSQSGEPLLVHYSELWDLPFGPSRPAEGACVVDTPAGARALADAASGIRARAPEPPPPAGLMLAVRLVVPPGEARTLRFAYAAPEPGEDPGTLVAAWRGEVERELLAVVRAGLESRGVDPIERYRRAHDG